MSKDMRTETRTDVNYDMETKDDQDNNMINKKGKPLQNDAHQKQCKT